MRTLLAAALAVSLLGACPARAQSQESYSPEVLHEANELASLQVEAMASDLARNFGTQHWPPIKRDLEARVDHATLEKLRLELTQLFAGAVTTTIRETPSIYARRFTVEELREMNGCLRSPSCDRAALNLSPTGQKMAREMPRMWDEVMTLVMARKEGFQAQVGEVFRRVMREQGYIR